MYLQSIDHCHRLYNRLSRAHPGKREVLLLWPVAELNHGGLLPEGVRGPGEDVLVGQVLLDGQEWAAGGDVKGGLDLVAILLQGVLHSRGGDGDGEGCDDESFPLLDGVEGGVGHVGCVIQGVAAQTP